MRTFLAVLVTVFVSAVWTGPTRAAGEDISMEVATFAGGCFWCMQPAFEKLKGVLAVTAGYTGGHTANPSYEEVSSGTTGHVEAVQVVFDPRKISYPSLLEVYWHNIDPTRNDGQFCDKGSQYRPVIFYQSKQQKEQAERSESEIRKTKPFAAPVVVHIVKAGPFYPAEKYHQDYYRKNPVRYKTYRFLCGRDQRLKQLWGAEAARE